MSGSAPSGPLIGSFIKPVSSAIDVTLRCDECGSAEIIEDHHNGVNVCSQCGLQLGGQLISEQNEWRDFDDDGPTSHGTVSSRVGGPEGGLIDMGLSTVMAASVDGLGANLARLQSKSTATLDAKVLMDAFRRASRLAASLSLPAGIVDRTNHLYKRVLERGVFKAKKFDAVLVACLYIACRHEGVPRTLKEICQTATGAGARKAKEITVKDVTKAFKRIKQSRAYQSQHEASQQAGTATATAGPPTSVDTSTVSVSTALSSAAGASAASLVSRYCSQLRLPLAVEKLTETVLAGAEAAGCLEGRAPATVAGAAIFLATQLASVSEPELRRPVERVSTVSLTSPTTIKKAYKEIFAKRTQILPEHWHAAAAQIPPP